MIATATPYGIIVRSKGKESGPGSEASYPARDRPLAPRALAPILRVPASVAVKDPAIADLSLADLDLDHTVLLPERLFAPLADAIIAVASAHWDRVAQVRAFPRVPVGATVDVVVSRRTRNVVARSLIPPAFLAEATIGDLMALPGFGAATLLELMSAVEAAAGRSAWTDATAPPPLDGPTPSAGYPARGKPLAPAVLAPVLDAVINGAGILAGRHLADLDTELSDSLDAETHEQLALAVRRRVAARWPLVAAARPFASLTGFEALNRLIGVRTLNCLGRAKPEALRGLTIGELMAIENFGVGCLLDLLAGIDVALERSGETPERGPLVDDRHPSRVPRIIDGGEVVEQTEVLHAGASPRVLKMYSIYEEGGTLEDVACRYDITRERVRQLFRDAGLHVRSVAEAAAMKRDKLLSANTGEIVRLFKEVGDEGYVARKLGIPRAIVESVVRDKVRRYQLHRKGKETRPIYTNDELIACLRQASSSLGGVLTTARYTAFARSQTFPDGRLWPTHQTPSLRFGSWRAALEEAGLRSNPASAIAGQRLFERGHCIDALREVERALGHIPTAAEYEEYARQVGGAIPSLATVRNRCGSWQDALRLAFLS